MAQRTRLRKNKAEQLICKGEPAFRIKKATATPETLQQQFATRTHPKSTEQKVTPQEIQHNPRTRLREKTTPPTAQDTAAPHTTKSAAGQGLPHFAEVHHGGDYWHREGILEESTHQAAHTAFYTQEQTHDGPDIKRLTPCKQTKVQLVGEKHITRLVEDEWTTHQAKTSDKPRTGRTNFE